jgi:anti-anti-sigma factor
VRIAPLLDVEVLGDPDQPERTLVVSGELDLAAAPELERAVEVLCREGVQELTIDLRRLSFMDCAGFATLVAAADFCHDRGCATRLLASDGPVRRLIKVIEELSAARGHVRLPDVLPPDPSPAG